MKIYSFWRSSAAYRVRIALNLKSIDADYEYVDLMSGDHLAETYGDINP